MAALTPNELAALRRKVGASVVPIIWDKTTLNTATQGVEDVLEAQGFDAVPLVAETVVNNARAQGVKSDLDAGLIPSGLVPVVEDWLAEHPPSVVTRSVNDSAIAAHVTSNMPTFLAAVSGMPAAQRVKLIRLVIRRRVEAAV